MGFKPSNEEQKWAKLIDIDLRKYMKEKVNLKMEDIIPEIIPATCPNDKIPLESSELDGTGIIVHKCSFCGGIWMDRINIERLFHSSKKSSVLLTYLAKILNIEISEI